MDQSSGEDHTSLWFLPVALIISAVIVAWVALSLSVDESQRVARWLHSGSAQSASDLMSSLLTSMITMTTLAISITMVVLALAAGQLESRLIRSFMADRRTQGMLGFFLATIFYQVLVLRVVNEGERDGGVPHLAVTIGAATVLICVVVLLFFVHHLARSIVADTIIERVGRELDSAIDEMLPEPDPDGGSAGISALPNDGVAFSLERSGYVQAIDYAALVTCARKADAVITLDFRPGKHVLPKGQHGRVRPASALSDTVWEEISASVVLGHQRTAAQDLEFSIRQLVEVALRAISPGINDPYTAIAAIDRLGASLAHAMCRGNVRVAWTDDDGRVRVIGNTTTFRGIVDVAFNQLRQASRDQPAVLIRMLATLSRLWRPRRHGESSWHRPVVRDLTLAAQ